MYWTQKHVLVCTASHCAQKGSNDLIGRLTARSRAQEARRGNPGQQLRNNRSLRHWAECRRLSRQRHLERRNRQRRAPVIAYLRGEGNPPGIPVGIDAPAEVARRDFYRAASDCGGACPADRFEEIATEHGFDTRWIDEQARRGFIARKPHPETGEPAIVITKKAADRYRLVREGAA